MSALPSIPTLPTDSSATALRLAVRAGGYDPTPATGKAVFLDDWSTRCLAPSPDEIRSWEREQRGARNTGLLCERLAVIDIDVLQADIVDRLRELVAEMLGPTPLRRVGQAPKVALFFRSDAPLSKLDSPHFRFSDDPKEKDSHVEILCKGQQVIAFGRHPGTGKNYTWEDKTPVDVPYADLPVVTKAQVVAFLDRATEILLAAGGRPTVKIEDRAKENEAKAQAGLSEYEALTPDEVADALSYVPNDFGYDDWVRIGFAIYSALGNGGRSLWETWSAKSPSNVVATTRRKWPSFAKGRNISAGTLIHHALAHGWPGSRRNRDGDTLAVGQKPAEAIVQSNDNAPSPASVKPAPKAKPKDGIVFDRGVPLNAARDRAEIAPELEPSPEFPIGSLPPVIGDAVRAIIDHVQVPPALAAHGVISAAMLATQHIADVYIPQIGRKPISMFMLFVGESGERKSAVDRLALRAVEENEQEGSEAYKDAVATWKAQCAARAAERKLLERNKDLSLAERTEALRNLQDPHEPLRPMIKTEEGTYEGLVNLLGTCRPSLGLFSAEGGQFVGGFAMSDDARVRTITGLSTLWDKGAVDRVRAAQASSYRGRRLSISIQVQPTIAEKLLGDEVAIGQGFVGRFLMTMPESRIGFRTIRDDSADDDERLHAFYKHCRRCLDRPLSLRAGSHIELDPPCLHLSRDALKLWVATAQALENGCRPDGMWRPVKSAALKLAENIGRLAAVLTLFENPRAMDGGDGEISGETMAQAVSVASFYLTEALRLTGNAALSPETRNLQTLATWLTNDVGVGELTSIPIIQKHAPRSVRATAEVIRQMVRKLVDNGVLEAAGANEIGGKRYRDTYRIMAEAGIE